METEDTKDVEGIEEIERDERAEEAERTEKAERAEDEHGDATEPGQTCGSPWLTDRSERIAPVEAVLDAMGAYDYLARRAVHNGRGDISKVQVDIVLAIAFYGPATMTELAQNLAVSKEHITRAVSSLAELGYVEKRRSANSLRCVEAVLTEEGTRLAQRIRVDAIARLEERLASIAPEERAALVEASEKAAAVLHKIKQS